MICRHRLQLRAYRTRLAPVLLCLVVSSLACSTVFADEQPSGTKTFPFGNSGKFKMLYDARQRPQSVYLHGGLYIVYNGDAKPTKNDKGDARPMLVRYDPQSRTFSKSQRLGSRSSDHHFCPIIWADGEDFLHVLHGCHKTPGEHLISEKPVSASTQSVTWKRAAQIAPKLSYPTAFQISDGRELIYYRTDGHTSSWTYRTSKDNGATWAGPAQAIVDLDSKGRLDWSSYHTKLPSKDGKFLHVVFTDYDDNKHSPEPSRFYNPKYDREVSNEWKYNLSYVKIDLQSDTVFNANDDTLRLPIDIEYSKEKCQIWDTQWRGAGVPPAVALDNSGNPTFLHVVSEQNLTTHRYYYVRREKNSWLKTPICDSNHQWNSCHLRHDDDGTIRAYVVTDEGYLAGGYMDRHGGGRIEEWVSRDNGHIWSKHRTVSPTDEKYAGWRFNNIQPVVQPDGSEVKGMLLFYGWKDPSAPEAKAFLMHD